jgi:hypothetical protein
MLNKDNERMLAYTARVSWVQPIEGADNIELIGINGWTCIAKIGEFKEGDICVYFEIDSKLPEAPWSAFMASKHYKVKTMKLGKFKVISQGLALPAAAFDIDIPLEENVDMTKTLGVTYSIEEDNKRKANSADKYAAMTRRHPNIFKRPIARWLMKREWGKKLMFLFFGKKKENKTSFPTHFEYVKKTDEERIECVPHLLKNKTKLIASEKLDGTSTTFILERKGKKKFEFYVLSRNVRQLTPDQKCYHDDNIYWNMAFKYNIEQHLKNYLNENPELKYVCLQGESVGSVQGNPLKLKEDDFYGFNFIRSDVGRISSLEGKKILESWGMKWVPIISTEWVNPDTMEEMKKLATGKSLVNPEVYREGIVYRSEEDNKLSFKSVSAEYLLKHNI